MNYPIYLLSGLIFWNFFAQTTTVAMQQLVWGSSLIKRVYIPRTIFSVAVVGNGLVNILLALIPLAIVMLVLRHPFTFALIILPVALFFASLFVLGISLMISVVAAFFTDVVEMYNVGLSALFYLSPIIYPISIVPERFQFFLKINPIYVLLELFRLPIFSGQVPSRIDILAGGVIALITFIIGWFTFTSRANEFAYRI